MADWTVVRTVYLKAACSGVQMAASMVVQLVESLVAPLALKMEPKLGHLHTDFDVFKYLAHITERNFMQRTAFLTIT